MNKLPLFKTEDLFKVIQDLLFDYDIFIEDAPRNMHQKYSFDYEDVYENGEHYLDVVVLETSEHYPWQVGDIYNGTNNKFRIQIECMK